MKNFTEKSEISFHLIKIWRYVKQKQKWVSHQQISEEANVNERTVRAHIRYLVSAGLVDKMEMFPQHRYRYSEMGEKRNKTFCDRLESASAIFSEVESEQKESAKNENVQ